MTPFTRPLLAAVALLALPGSAAAATTYTVNPGEKIQDAVDKAAAGDTIQIKAGTYNESVSVGTAGLTFTGDPGTVVQNPSTATGSTPVFKFTATSGQPDVISGLIVINAVTSAPAIQASASGLALRDSTVLSAKGDGVDFAGAADQVQRSTIASIAAAGSAIGVATGLGGAAETLTIDSTALAGKSSLTAAYAQATVAGAGMTIAARHVTAIGDVNADASNSPTLGASPIAITFTDSIIRGKRTATSTGLSAGATITADTARNSLADTAADAAQLFVAAAKFNFHLRADAPVIGKGGVTDGESTTDIDGQPRSSGGVSDLGADEFVDRAPRAALAVAQASVRQNQQVTLDAAKSTDPDAGDSIVSYHWSFGDGQTATTTTPTTTHTYVTQGAVTATVAVVDKEGTSSDPATLALTVTDGTPPTLKILQPFSKQSMRAYRGKRRVAVQFFGTAADDTAMGRVYLALRPVTKAKGKCRWFDGKRSLKSADCAAPTTFTGTLSATRWLYRLPVKAKLPKGLYYLYAVPVDASGLPGATQIVKFRIR